MKTRQGYVSNSSSSSFIVIGNGSFESDQLKVNETGTVLLGPRIGGEYEFGWDVDDHYGVYSRINFAYIQAISTNNQDWLNLIEQAVKEETGAKCIEWCHNNDCWNGWEYGYIDHQSAACEGENVEMFDSLDKMKRFLFCNDSYIHTDNDNY